MVICLYTDYSNKLAGEPIRMFDSTSILVVFLDLVPLNLVSVVMLLSCARKHQNFNNILEILEIVDQKLQQKVPEVKAKSKVVFMFIVTVTLIMWDGILDCKRSFSLGYKDHFRSLCYVPPLSMHFAQVAMFLHFTHVNQSVATRFSIVNLRVKQEVMRSRQVQPMNIQRLSNVSVPQSDRGVSSTREVESLMSAYWLLCDAVHQTNAFYGDQLLAVLFSTFLSVTTGLFYLPFTLIPGDTITAAATGAWVITYVSYLVLLVHSGTLLAELADETAPMICKLINTDLDPTLVKCFEGFLLQLGKNKPRLSGLGFVDVHNSTLTGMAAAVTTYLVVLIQWRYLRGPRPVAVALSYHTEPIFDRFLLQTNEKHVNKIENSYIPRCPEMAVGSKGHDSASQIAAKTSYQEVHRLVGSTTGQGWHLEALSGDRGVE
ncbi:gustatory receptor [Homalodisca vitripennis]|nr:gustatory receptor [Homalodisca vitripennis]KAG8320564.1 gustatory receptor [Homalodisca vitripennis]